MVNGRLRSVCHEVCGAQTNISPIFLDILKWDGFRTQFDSLKSTCQGNKL